MGAYVSRRAAGVEEVDISSNNAYRFPPRSGCYFGSHFIMGGERFETTQPEAYLFGDNQDLNFLGNRPIPFPYPAPQAHEPTKTLKSLVNIRKDAVRFVKVLDEEDKDDDSEETAKYNIEFTFDTDVRVAITIFYFATEEICNGQAVYHPRDPAMNSETYHYKRGANQVFSQASHIIEPVKFGEEEWQYNSDKEVIPVVIQCSVEEEQYIGHSHITFAIVEKTSEIGYVLKPLKQKQMVDGLCYLLQEIYGIENKNTERSKIQDDDFEDTGSECVICMSDTRDTLILPCRHLCLCNTCADNLRYQANNCPICRAPFRALLQIRAMRKKVESVIAPQTESDDPALSQEGVPPGYEAVSLIEALNGPNTSPAPVNPIPTMPPDGNNGRGDAKLKRTSSTCSTGSKRSHQPIDEETIDSDRPQTPEVIMSASAPDPVKPRPNSREESKEKATQVVSNGSCEIVNELEIAKNDKKNTGDKSPPPEYEETVHIPAAHTAVLYTEKPDEDTEEERDPLYLPSQVLDTCEPATGSSIADGSGSSYSSTNSSKGLLDNNSPSKDSESK